MPPPAVVLRRLTVLSLLSVLLLVGVPPVAQGVPARSWPGGSITAYPHAASTPPRAGRSHEQRWPSLPVRMWVVDHADRRLQYRVVGDLVQRSTDGGRQWATILTPGGSRRSGSCYPARYRRVSALVVSGLLPGTLFVATAGQPARVPRTRHKGACAAATGGLFVLRPDGHGGLRRTDSLAAGLPYAQAAPGRTPRAYALRALVTDPTNPAVLYADAAVAPATLAGPASPPAGLYRSSNGGLSWSPAMAGLPRTGPGPGAARGTLILDPAHGATVFNIIGTTLYRSVNRGASWVAVRAIPARHTLHLVVNPANPHLVYALSDLGLYHSRDAGATWTCLTARRLPAVGRIRALTFDVRAPASVSVVPWQGPPLRLVESRAPAPPRFDLALSLTPQWSDRVVLAVHAAPLARARLTVVGGATRTSARLRTDAAGFGYATVHLTGPVVATALRVRVQIGRRTLTLKPWLPPGWVPGRATQPRPAATPIPTATAPSTATPTRMPTASMPTASPTPSDPATSTPTPVPPTPTSTPVPPSPTPTSTPTATPMSTPTPVPPTPTSTSTPVPPSPTSPPVPKPAPTATLTPTGGIIQEYRLGDNGGGGEPWGTAMDASGNVWFAEPGCDFAPTCASSAPAGQLGELLAGSNTVRFYRLPNITGNQPIFVALDNAGNVWFTTPNNNMIGEFNPTTQSFVGQWAVTAGSGPWDLTFDQTGTIWYTEHLVSAVGAFNPSTHTHRDFMTPTNNTNPYGIAASGRLIWFTENNSSVARIAMLDTSDNDQISEYLIRQQLPGGAGLTPHMIGVDANGHPWWTEGWVRDIGTLDPDVATPGQCGTVSSAGDCTGVTELPLPAPPSTCPSSHVSGLAVQGDSSNQIWLDDSLSNQVGVYNPATNQFALANLRCGVHPHDGLNLDPALHVWWDEEFNNALGKVTP